jgi:hypothetical protein
MIQDEVEAVIYRDERYPSMWIDDSAGFPDKIAQYLRGKGLKVLNADELREYLIRSIEEETAYEKLVIFSQDVIPDTVAQDYYSNTTLREFLDRGGSILWIGDIPAFYIGKKIKVLDQEAWKRGSPVFMLGIVPIFAHSVKESVVFTDLGKKLGLKHRWSGIRPIIPDIGIKVLAESEIVFGQPYITNILSREITESLMKPIKEAGIEAGIPQILKLSFAAKEEIEARKIEASLQFVHKKFPNAWLKNYNRDHPNTGLFRIWDYSPRNLTQKMLEELHNFINTITILIPMRKQIKQGRKLPFIYYP